jgi:mannose-6-phosphate isomerase-like protein (cupin superfamily)
MKAVLHRPGEGEHVGGRPTAVTIKAAGEDTSDSFWLGEVVVQPGFAGLPPHVHERIHEMFYVLEGVLAMRLDDHTIGLNTPAR